MDGGRIADLRFAGGMDGGPWGPRGLSRLHSFMLEELLCSRASLFKSFKSFVLSCMSVGPEQRQTNLPWRSGVSKSPERTERGGYDSRTRRGREWNDWNDGAAWWQKGRSRGWDDGGDSWTCRSRGLGEWDSRSDGWDEFDWWANPGGKGEAGWQSSYTDENLFQDQRSPFQRAIDGPSEEDHSAVAAPAAPDAIVTYYITTEPPLEQFGLEYFLNFQPITDSYKIHNVALKWFRELCEREGLTEHIFSNTAVADVPVINHRKGTDYSFDDESHTFPWRWQEMVANLTADAIRDILTRDETFDPRRQHAEHFIECKIQQTGQYCHKRAVAAKKGAIPENVPKREKPLVWDFVLTRSDGMLIGLHPSYGNNKVECKFGLPGTDDQVPAAGPGGSDGRGTYRHFIYKYVDTILKFDGQKNPGKGGGGGKGRGKGATT